VPERTNDRRSPTRGLDHLTIECVTPELDGGRYPVKRIVGDVVQVGADVIKEGHDVTAAHIVVRSPTEPAWSVPMQYDSDSDRWLGAFSVDQVGRWHFTVEAWTDAWETWRSGFRKKVDAGVNTRVELLEGAQLVKAAARRAARGPVRASLTQTARAFESVEDVPSEAVIKRALDPELATLMRETFVPRDLTRYGRELAVIVDRERARIEQARHVREEDRHVVRAALVHGGTRIRPDEQGPVPEVRRHLGREMRPRSLDVQVDHADVAQLRRPCHEGVEQDGRRRRRAVEVDLLA